MKEHSAGILIETRDGFLACHPTFKSKDFGCWDIPKGHIEEDENARGAMARELTEETGLKVKWPVKDCGLMPYTKHKDLHMFYAYIDESIDLSKLKCTSMFELHGRKIPEMNDYLITKDLKFFYPNLQPVLTKVLEMMHKKD